MTSKTGPGKLMTDLKCNNISLQELNRKQVKRAHELLDQAILDALQGRSDREIEKITITIPKHGSKLGKPKAAIEYS